jgi:8-amino-7-oxononanoate synthase
MIHKTFSVASSCLPRWAIDYLTQAGRTFVFSTAPPPAMAAGLEAALDLVVESTELRQKLCSLTQLLRRLLADEGTAVARTGSQIVPVIIGDNSRALQVAQALQQDGFDVRAIRPPTVPRDTARLRISVNTGLDDATLRRFVQSLSRYLREAGVLQ